MSIHGQGSFHEHDTPVTPCVAQIAGSIEPASHGFKCDNQDSFRGVVHNLVLRSRGFAEIPAVPKVRLCCCCFNKGLCPAVELSRLLRRVLSRCRNAFPLLNTCSHCRCRLDRHREATVVPKSSFPGMYRGSTVSVKKSWSINVKDL